MYAIKAVKLKSGDEPLIKILGCTDTSSQVHFVFVAKAHSREPRTGEWLFIDRQLLPNFDGPAVYEKRKDLFDTINQDILPELTGYFLDPLIGDKEDV